jgi:hypothetical protein
LAFESENIDEYESAKEEDDSANTIKTTLGIYSNNESMALTYASIFEKLWIQNETYGYVTTKNQLNSKQ